MPLPKTPLRPYQATAVEHAGEWLWAAKVGDKRVYTAPTGTGKSLIELHLLHEFQGATLITPRVEIQSGLLEKLGFINVPLAQVCKVAESERIYTPIRLRNLLANGTLATPTHLIIDEGHHATANTYELLDALLGQVPAIGFTATGFRGTPKGTAAFLKIWNRPVPIITFAEAAREGYLSVPSCRIEPLIDDDTIEVTNGEFVVTQMDDAVGSVIAKVVELSDKHVDHTKWGKPLWDRPTMFTVPTVNAATELAYALDAAGLPAVCVTGDTPPNVREIAFKCCVIRDAAIVQVNVVSEGIDLPIRRLVDLRPTLSPVLWMQTLGRITRPVGEHEPPPEYICCCRNLLRHAYLLEGCIPPGAIVESETAFGGVGKRAGMRVLGFEGIGRFKATELPLLDGSTGLMYCLSAVEGNVVTQYTLLSAPNRSEVLVARRSKPYAAEWDRSNKWVQVDEIPDVVGFASVPPRALTEKQEAWWKRSAATRGLNADAKVNSRNFQALPVLMDLRSKMV